MKNDQNLLKWTLIAAAIVLTATIRLVPADWRPYNFTAVGALALFVAARVGLWQSVLIASAAMLLSDFVQYAKSDFQNEYLPFLATYCGLAIYSFFGFGLLRRTENLLKVGGTALMAGLLFYLSTNFASWLSPVHHYERSFAGLMASYEAGLPFLRGTLAGDLFFSITIFGLAALVPAGKPIPATVEESA
jgi:hypothetical protein